jgi:Ca-activated chloride channel family protein
MKRLALFVGIGLIVLFNATAGLAAAFQATMVETRRGKTQSGQFYMLADKYRMEVVQENRQLIILVDRHSGRTRLLVPSEGVYLEMANSDMQSLMNNPFEAHQHMIDNFEPRSAGSETVDGIVCDKQVIAAQGKDVMTAWIAKPFGFPIRLENQMSGSRVELKNIQQTQPPSGMFEVPARLKQVERMPVAPPEWAADIASAPVLTPPFEQTLEEGQIIRINPKAGQHIRVSGRNAGSGKSAFTSVAFKDGRPLVTPSMGTYNVSEGGGMSSRHKQAPGEADMIVVRARTGRVAIDAQFVQAPPKGVILKKYTLNANSGRGVSLDHRRASRLIIADSGKDGRAATGDVQVYSIKAKDAGGGATFYENDKELVRDRFQLAGGASRVWYFDADQKAGTANIDLQTGSVEVRTEQPEKPGDIPPSWAKLSAGGTMAAASAVPVAAPAPSKSVAAPAPKASSPAAAAPGHSRMVLVLDGSGSMWGQIDGKAKIAIAKGVMAELIDQIPADFETGLTVYGHRRKGDCSDIEMLIPVGPHNPAAMKAKVQAISPKGKTPLSEAVRQAAQALRYTEERATVVLVSDGLETCDIDPCELAAELAMSGVDFTVHVIGFDISQEDQGRLRCLADKTGGLFLAADSAGALRDALLTTVEQVKAPPPPVVEDPGTATLSAPPAVPAGSEFQVQWEGPDSRDDYIAIAEKGSKDLHHRDYTYTQRGNPVDFLAPGDVGEYEMRYIHAHTRKVIGRTGIKVTPVQASVQAPASVDVAVNFDVQWQGPQYKSDYISIARPDQRPGSYVNYTYTREGNPVKVRAPSDPGTYEVRYILGRGNKLLAKTTIEIKAVTAEVQAAASADIATEFEVAWQGPANKEDYISVARPDQRPGSYVNYTYTREGSPLKVRAPSDPGTYEVRYILGRGKKLLAKTTIEIKAVTAEVQAAASADMATEFEVTWQGPANKEDYISVARPDQRPGSYVNYMYTRDGSPLKVRAPSDPGTYEVRYILGRGKKLLAKTTIEIKAVTANVTAPASAKAGEVFEVTWEGPDYKSDYISIARPDQRPQSYKGYTYTSTGNPVKVKAPKEPGTYDVRYILGRGKKLLARTTIKIMP